MCYRTKWNRAPIYAVIFLLVLILFGASGIAYVNVKLAREKDRIYSSLSQCGFPEYEEKVKTIGKQWKELNIIQFQQKNEIIRKLKRIKKELANVVDEKIQYYAEVDMTNAEAEDEDVYNAEMDKLMEMIEEDWPDYTAISESLDTIDKAVFMYIPAENELDIHVQQIDASDFPRVRLYVDVKDRETEETVDDLDQMLFYLKQKDASANFIKQKIIAAHQIDDVESLKVDMVADVSGSMSGTPITNAKAIMCNFVDSMQFNKGDLVELTSFSTGVRIEQEFCGDTALLKQKINSFKTDSQTSLYDALYTSVSRVAGETGAKCVIAFTDGEDNYSSCTVEDVISAAQRYRIPVFIIGIGNSIGSSMSYISSQTGGKYYSINDVNLMESLYREIYRMEKELYMIEYEDSTGTAVDATADITLGYHSKEYSGTCDYKYRPNVLLSVKSPSVYQAGPESVVEKYLQNFAVAVTKNDFSYISDYLKPGSTIYNEQAQFVQRSIEEKLDTYELTGIERIDNTHCIISTRETYSVQVAGESLHLMTQECRYALEQTGDRWYMTSIVDLNVVSRIR